MTSYEKGSSGGSNAIKVWIIKEIELYNFRCLFCEVDEVLARLRKKAKFIDVLKAKDDSHSISPLKRRPYLLNKTFSYASRDTHFC